MTDKHRSPDPETIETDPDREDSTEYRISVDQLRVGVFIRLEAAWFDHPFMFSSFIIKEQAQIDALKELGLESVVFVPEKSNQMPADAPREPPAPRAKVTLPEGGAGTTDAPEPAPPGTEPSTNKLWQKKKERIARLRQQRESMIQCENRFHKTVEQVRKVMQNLNSASEAVIGEADLMVKEVVKDLLSDEDLVVHLMNTRSEYEDVYYHSVNVTVLALMLGKECGLDVVSLRALGLGSLFHDIGKQRIPRQIVQKQTQLTSAEHNLMRLHPQYGEEMISEQRRFPSDARKVIRQHHEMIGGQGYPDKLTGDKISPLAKIVAITNAYDNYCNARNPWDSLSPYQALSLMFGRQKDRFNEELLERFIRCLGVYPPGTFVLLSNGSIGIVCSLTPKSPLRPSVLLYHSDIPREEALIVDLLGDPDIEISKSLRPRDLPPEIHDYLSPKRQVTYFIDTVEKREE